MTENSLLRFAHISDLHFACPPFGPLQFFSKRWLGNLNYLFNRKNDFVHERLPQLIELFKAQGVTHVIISGDFSITSRRRELRMGKQFVKSLEDAGFKIFTIPGNHDHYGSSYSYQWQPPAAKLLWNTGQTMVILGDQNPLVDANISGNVVPANSMSINHNERGQNVLMSDGTILWLTVPRIGQDNIWLPQGVLILQAGQQPADASDTFLVH